MVKIIANEKRRELKIQKKEDDLLKRNILREKYKELNKIKEHIKNLKNKHSNIAEWELEKYGLTAYS